MHVIKYSPPLDGLRALCILFTLFNHIAGVPAFIQGTVGVDVFFPLSGFLITGILLSNNWNDLRGYYIRRWFRIAPVYYLALAATLILALVTHRLALGESKLDQIQMMLVQSVLFSRELSDAPTLFGQAWTVGIEEKFYLAWPVLFLLLKKDRARLVFLGVLLIALALIAKRDFLRGYGGIAFGCTASILYFRHGLFIRTSYALVLAVAAYVACYYTQWNLLIALASALLIPSLYATESAASRFLSHKTMVFLGRLTFSLYMFHVMVFAFAKLALKRLGADDWYFVFMAGYSASVLTAWLVYRFFESPLIARGKRLARA